MFSPPRALAVWLALACTGCGGDEGPSGDECPLLPPSPFAGGLSATNASSFIEIGGERLDFELSDRSVETARMTAYGMADVTTCIATAGTVERRTEIYALSEFPNTYLVGQIYTFGEAAEVNEARALTVELPVDDVRLTYGPAHDTLYMMEDYLNIPAVVGYAKAGAMRDGGLPLNDAWNADGGVAIGVLTDVPGTYELPLAVDAALTLGHRHEPDESLGEQLVFAAGEAYRTDMVFVAYHEGDYFEPIDRYTRLLERVSDRAIQNQPTPDFARRPYWKTWGLDPNASGNFTKDEVRGVADELDVLGIDWIMLDYGWFMAEGNWEANPDMFTDDADLAAFVAELTGRGFHVGLWFQPLQIDLTDDTVQSSGLIDFLVRDSDGEVFIDDDDLALLDPSFVEVQQYVKAEITRFADMGVEHLYLDSQMAQLASPPNFASPDPLRSHRALPDMYRQIDALANERGIAVEICPDGRSHTILNLPQHIANVGDPKNDRQLRAELKSLKAMLGARGIVGAYVDPFEDNRVSGSFLNIVGIGGMLQTLFRDVADLGADTWTQYLDLYFDEDIVSGSYLDLYDVGFDYPEGHCVERDGTRYYTFFTHTEGVDVCVGVCVEDSDLTAVEPAGERGYSGFVELRDLEPGATYLVTHYPESTGVQNTADDDGTILLQDVAFEKEVLFIVSP